jgi:hypothetical protein
MPAYRAIINDTEYGFECATGDYAMAVVCVLAEWDIARPCMVEIWSEEVMPDYGPYTYEVGSNEYGDMVVKAKPRSG